MNTELLKQLDIDEYHASAFISNSKLTTFLRRGPRGFWMRYLHKSLQKEDSPALRTGLAFDTLLFDGEGAYLEKFVERPPGMKFTTKEGKAWKAEQDEAGRIVIESEDARAFEWMCAAIREHELGSDLLHACDKQVSLRGEYDGLPGIQSRPDGLCLEGCAATDYQPFVLDLKTTSELDMLTGGRSIPRYGYHRQMGFSSLLLNDLGVSDLRYFILAVEKAVPHRAQVVELSEAYVRAGELEVRRGLSRLSTHYQSGEWPRVTEDVVVLDPPRWMRTEEDESAHAAA